MHRLAVSAVLLATLSLHAEDWPEWRGAGRTGVWKETGIVERFASAALTPKWRTPIGGGFAGPAVAAGRIYVTDYVAAAGNKGIERAHCLDEQTGKILWTREWPASYQGISPHISPTTPSKKPSPEA